jgi:hypothetical protein
MVYDDGQMIQMRSVCDESCVVNGEVLVRG